MQVKQTIIHKCKHMTKCKHKTVFLKFFMLFCRNVQGKRMFTHLFPTIMFHNKRLFSRTARFVQCHSDLCPDQLIYHSHTYISCSVHKCAWHSMRTLKKRALKYSPGPKAKLYLIMFLLFLAMITLCKHKK